ncbi:MAG TPA: winged helix-turn-helix domain-containing protein, partial [Solirubrobacteraceae bacterium]|nr:winged helix-turn-helix domain-containing protein [Solirubrobacteraceae bacterium]
EILAHLNEAVYTPEDLRKLIGVPSNTIGYHIKELLEDGSIELARTAQVRNTVQHYYRAVKIPFFSDEEIAAMTLEEKQTLAGLILEASMAEALAAFWAGKMIRDPRVWLTWRWFNVDVQGRNDIADEQAESWARIFKIQAESATRMAESGEKPVSIIVTSLGYERCRNAPAMSGCEKP